MSRRGKKLFRFLRTKPVPANTNEILALERTKLANERTLLSYIRSSLYLLLGGIALLQLKDFRSVHWLGYVALVICVLFLAVGIFRYVLLYRRLYKWNRVLYVDTTDQKTKEQVDSEEEKKKEAPNAE
jgi:putative membrane protein